MVIATGARPGHLILTTLLSRSSLGTIPRRIPAGPASLGPISPIPRRSYGSRKPGSRSSPFARVAAQQMDNIGRGGSSPSTRSNEDRSEILTGITSILSPGTFVPPPLFKHMFSEPYRWFKNLYTRIKSQGAARISLLLYKISSKPSFFKFSRFKIKRSSIVPTGKALHRAVWEGLAAGDLAGLRKVTHPTYHDSLSLSIDRRKQTTGRRLEWQLVKYTRPLFFPRVVDDRVLIADSVETPCRQAVVAISSRQKVVEYDDRKGGVVVSEKEKDVVEYIVLYTVIDPQTFSSTPWKVSGFTDEMEYEQSEKLQRLVADLNADKGKKHLQS